MLDSLIIVCLRIKNEIEYYKIVSVYFDLQNVILLYVPIWVGQGCQGVCGNVSIWIFAAGRGLQLPLSFLTIHVFASLQSIQSGPFLKVRSGVSTPFNNMHSIKKPYQLGLKTMQ